MDIVFTIGSQKAFFRKLIGMKYTDVLDEELEIDSEIESLNKNFRKYIEQVFSPTFLNKIDRVFKEPLIIRQFKEKSNVMAVTVGSQISVNTKMFQELSTDRGMVYIIHELFHVLQNLSQFNEVRTVNRILMKKTMNKISEANINSFLTGKDQNIHSDYKDEFLSYCSNFAFNWKFAPELKQEYYETLKNSGLFNMESKWWSKRFKPSQE